VRGHHHKRRSWLALSSERPHTGQSSDRHCAWRTYRTYRTTVSVRQRKIEEASTSQKHFAGVDFEVLTTSETGEEHGE